MIYRRLLLLTMFLCVSSHMARAADTRSGPRGPLGSRDESPAARLAKKTLPIEARIKPLGHAAMVGKAMVFQAEGLRSKNSHYVWDFGDGAKAEGDKVEHRFEKPAIYRVVLTVSEGADKHSGFALVRVHTVQSRHLPQVLLDTDAKNEVDDQHYISYGLLSEIDVLGINSIHHGGGQEATNYAEIQHVIALCRESGLPKRRVPRIFHGADRRLVRPASGKWFDTQPIVTEASEAILAAARGAAPDNKVWVLPVGPCTNIASAILQARREGLDLKTRIRICWLGGGPKHAHKQTFNGGNDPWSVYVTGQSGVDFWVLLENPTGASVTIDKRTESGLYPDNPLGKYLLKITPVFNWRSNRAKSLYDLTTISTVISQRLGRNWLTEVEPARVLGPEHDYAWQRVDGGTSVRIIRDIDEAAMKKDFFDTLNGHPTQLLGVAD